MKMRAIVALRDFPYAGKQRRKGDVFQASERDARILIAIGRAQADPAPFDGPKQPGKETEVKALVVEALEIQPQRPRGRPRKTTSVVEQGDHA